MSGAPVLEVRDLRTHFGAVRAVDGVSFAVGQGEVLGLVGESGSGKSVTGFSIMGLVDPPGRVMGGQVWLEGREITPILSGGGEAMRRLRGARVAMVFQDPLMTLNPVLRVGTQMAAAVRAHATVSRAEAWSRAEAALATVGIPSPRQRLSAYPFQLSGGMRQRVAIATALLHAPAAIIADEPTTALDVSIQAQILAEVRRLADETGTAFVWITHDLAVVSSLADHVCVMYAGRVVERGPADAVIARPRHHYTAALVASVPSGHVPGSRLPQVAAGAALQDAGCPFRPRCPAADGACAAPVPAADFGDGHVAMCHHPVGA